MCLTKWISKTTTDKDIEQLNEQTKQNLALDNQINYIENKQNNSMPVKNENFFNQHRQTTK